MNRNRTTCASDDHALVERILSGSVEAWHRFIDAYTPLLFGVIRRYLQGSPDDERRSLYIQVLQSLYEGKLADYRGESRLGTWLFLFTRSRCLDALRSRNGRKRLPRALRGLSDIDREVYLLYYVRGCPAREICQRISCGSEPFDVVDLAECLERIDQRVDERTRRRSAFELHARSIGWTSGRLLEYVHHLRIEQEGKIETSNPEQELMRREVHRRLKILRAFVGRLPDIEKKVIALRFYHGYTARRTAEQLALAGERLVYTVEQRAIRRLRRMFAP